MSKHTKGPWKKHPYNSRMGTLISFGDLSKGENVATVFAQTSASEAKANADLFMAAPEMLGHLKEDFRNRQCVCKLNPLVGGPVPCDTCQLSSLIAKAEGRS